MTRLLKRKFHINTLVFVKDQQGWLRNIQYWNRFRDAVWGPVGNVHSHNLVIALPVLASLPERPEGRFVIQLSRIPRSMPAPRFWSTRPNWWGHETKEIPFASCKKKKKTGRGYHLSLRLIPDFRREISNLFSGGNVFNGAHLNLVSLCPCVSVVCICMCVGALVCAGARLEECTQESVILHLNPELATSASLILRWLRHTRITGGLLLLPDVCLGAEVPNSGPPTWMASAVPNEMSHLPSLSLY